MPYNNNGNQQKYTMFDVNTSSIIMFSENISLRMDLYNKNLQLGLIRAVQTAEGKNTYPKDSAIKVLLTQDRVQALVTLITEGVIPALEARRAYEAAIITNSKMTNMVLVGCNTDGIAYLDVYTGMDERRIPKEKARFIFQKNQTLSRFNPNTGDYEQGPDIQGQLYLFARCLEDFVFSSSMAAVHNYRIVENGFNRRLMNLLQEIASKMGIPVQRANDSQSGGYRYGGTGSQTSGFAQQSSSNTVTEATVTSLDAIDSNDLPF